MTADGAEFLLYAKQIYQQYEETLEHFKKNERKKKFSVSTQHYSFAVKAFVETIKKMGTSQYEFAIYETKTGEIIEDVSHLKSDIGLLYLSDFNRKALQKLFVEANVEFFSLISCQAYVYLWKGHPLADKKSIRLEELSPYPNLSFEQGEQGSFYYAEEILSTNEYPCTIKANDRATMLNLMVGLNGYTLCSGIICEELNGDDYKAVPFEADLDNPNSIMELGYILRKNMVLSPIAKRYLKELKATLPIRN